MKIKNKKAFTLVEVIAVIVIIGILLIITLPSINKAVTTARLKYFENQENMMLVSGRDYFTDYRERLPKSMDTSASVSLRTLVDNAYIEPILDTKKNSCDLDNSYVEATNISSGYYIYNIRLVCDDYDTTINWSEWSEWVSNPPSGQYIEVEPGEVYNYQELTSYYSDWSEWEDIAYDEGGLIHVTQSTEPLTENRTIYRYKDQQWKWYYEEGETSSCVSSAPAGTGWVKGSACDYTSSTGCATWGTGSVCGYEEGTPYCSSSGDGSACDWADSTTCSSTGTGSTCGYTTVDTSTCSSTGTGSVCAYSTETVCQESQPSGTGWTKGSGCDCVTGTIYTWRGPLTYERSDPCPTGETQVGYVNNTYYCSKPCAGNTYKEAVIRPGSDWCIYSTTGSSGTQCLASNWSRSVVSKRYTTTQQPNKWYVEVVTKRMYTPTTTKYYYTTQTASKWYYNRTDKIYADGYYSTAPVDYPIKDTLDTIYEYSSNWNDINWEPVITTRPTDETYRTTEEKDQTRSRTVIGSDWSGDQLSSYLTVNEFLQAVNERRALEGLTAFTTIEEMESDPNYKVIKKNMYRYRTRIY